MRENVNVGQARQCAEPNGGATIISEDHERRAGGAEKSVIGNAVHDRAHAVLANPKANVSATGIVTREIPAVFDVVHCRSVEIGAPTHEQRHRLRDRLQCFTTCFARCQLRILRKFRNLG